MNELNGMESLRDKQDNGGDTRREIEVASPTGRIFAREPVGVEVPEQQRDLEEDQTSQPDCGRTAERGEELFGGHRLNQEEKEGAEEDGNTIEQAGCEHSLALIEEYSSVASRCADLDLPRNWTVMHDVSLHLVTVD